ncbi:uncharacterized protein LOC112097351 [Citrus clementina]|uniref:uncharacterized protein LOC112097351 n=1 Tax=Citrus clementina TaxID=85681 RepID=UPI000CED1C52|nr:uncharacterized protein LOC112097351 [Citrus x clementina]
MATLKIDMSKAYDQIECGFLKAMMLRMGFIEGWVELIMMFVSTVSHKVIRNGVEMGPIIPTNLHEARIRKSLLAIFGQHVNYNKLAISFSANMDEAAKGQKLMTTPQSLVVRILKARYDPRSAFTYATLGFNPSYTWRSIMATKHVVVHGSRIQIGSGQRVQITKDSWLPDVDNGCIATVLDESLATAMVNYLMLPDQQRWDNDLVADVFNTMDAALILQVPLSARQDKDGWFWLTDPKGNYTIRSCYKLLNHVFNAPSSKVKVFPICPICSAANEFVLHCLVECLFSQSCWLLSTIGFVRSYSSFFEWIEQMFNRCSKEECKLAMMVCWRIWLNRNDKVWNEHSSRAQNLVNAAGRYLFQWQEARKRIFTIVELVQLGHGLVCWSKPPMDSFSFGGVIRDSRGAFVAAKCQCFPGLSSPREAEPLAFHEALNWMKSLQISKIIIEIDCLNVYAALINQSISPNGFGLIIEDCRALAQLIGEVSLFYS